MLALQQHLTGAKLPCRARLQAAQCCCTAPYLYLRKKQQHIFQENGSGLLCSLSLLSGNQQFLAMAWLAEVTAGLRLNAGAIFQKLCLISCDLAFDNTTYGVTSQQIPTASVTWQTHGDQKQHVVITLSNCKQDFGCLA